MFSRNFCVPEINFFSGPGTGLVTRPSSGAGTENALIRGYPLPDDCSSPSRLPFLHCRRFIPDKKNLSRVRNIFSIRLRKKDSENFQNYFFGNVFPVNLPENIPLLKKNYGAAYGADSFMPRKSSPFIPYSTGASWDPICGSPLNRTSHEPLICVVIWAATASGVMTSAVPSTIMTSFWMPGSLSHDPFQARSASASCCIPAG